MKRSPAQGHRILSLAVCALLTAACTDRPSPTQVLGLDDGPSRLIGSAQDGLPVVVVRANAPAQSQGALTNNLLDAVARVRPGGTIRVHSGTYQVKDVLISKPLTIEGVGSTLPVIEAAEQANAFSSFTVHNVPDGLVRIRQLRFRSETYTSIFLGADLDHVIIEDSEFHPGSAISYSSGVMGFGTRATSVLVRNSAFTGGDTGVLTGDAIGVRLLNNTFTNQRVAAIHDGDGGGVHAEANTIRSCGSVCIGVFGGGSVTLLRNTIEVDYSRPVTNAIQVHGGTYRIEENTITGSGGSRQPHDAGTWPIQSNAIAVDGSATVSGNRVSGAHNGLGLGNATIAGADNIITSVGSVLNIFRSTVTLHRSDFTDYARALQFVHEPGTSSLACNWWGSPDGPQNVDPSIDPALYTPWATQPIANTDASCGS